MDFYFNSTKNAGRALIRKVKQQGNGAETGIEANTYNPYKIRAQS
jgi:hypothetical protein